MEEAGRRGARQGVGGELAEKKHPVPFVDSWRHHSFTKSQGKTESEIEIGNTCEVNSCRGSPANQTNLTHARYVFTSQPCVQPVWFELLPLQLLTSELLRLKLFTFNQGELVTGVWRIEFEAQTVVRNIMLSSASSTSPVTSPSQYIVSVLGREEGYMVKYTPPPEGVPEGEARGNS